MKKTANIRAASTGATGPLHFDMGSKFRVPAYFPSEGVSTRADIWGATMVLVQLLGGSEVNYASGSYQMNGPKKYVVDVVCQGMYMICI